MIRAERLERLYETMKDGRELYRVIIEMSEWSRHKVIIYDMWCNGAPCVPMRFHDFTYYFSEVEWVRFDEIKKDVNGRPAQIALTFSSLVRKRRRNSFKYEYGDVAMSLYEALSMHDAGSKRAKITFDMLTYEEFFNDVQSDPTILKEFVIETERGAVRINGGNHIRDYVFPSRRAVQVTIGYETLILIRRVWKMKMWP